MSGDLAREPAKPYPKPVQTGRPAGATKRTARDPASPKTREKIRDLKCQACRVCNRTEGHIHAHHLVRKGAPYFGQWSNNNIVGLCRECHHELHASGYGSRVKKILRVKLTAAEVKYGDNRAYEGYFDDIYWRIRPVVTDGRQA